MTNDDLTILKKRQIKIMKIENYTLALLKNDTISLSEQRQIKSLLRAWKENGPWYGNRAKI